ncbi:hypothetical protein ATY89_03795 [Sulfolobus acidocaldarius]|uniref:Conserved conjugative plasmid membrane protein n=2 Tax=Sulfolobus acidocaldarius TaxID=2285 RepID=Q4JBB6_SULAC|nr:conserved conjugative plasmid membrane protein [Sulfolobus acidocaldarius DSM 639]ALU29146.1 hypothetical protein ATY89_03795 [Sulfolobus acidocaldarius]ALU31872.1 hypothetical protein ATZ20_06820 [Sulfolobus acidocaldarius]
MKEERIGWIYTISSLEEKSFPLWIKQVSLKQLAVIFPSALLALIFFSKSILIAMASLIPAIYIITYDEKSMDEFQYVYHFVKFYLLNLIAPSEKKEKKLKEEKEKIVEGKTTKKSVSLSEIIAKYKQKMLMYKKRVIRAGVSGTTLAVLLILVARDFITIASNLMYLVAVSIVIAVAIIEFLRSIYGKI